MQSKKILYCLIFGILLSGILGAHAQIVPGVYITDVDKTRHELKIRDGYLIHTVYEASPAKFIKTIGGFYTTEKNNLKVDLEFNSNYENDSIKKTTLPFSLKGSALVLHTEPELVFELVEPLEQDLDGAWLFATRGPDTGQKRRDDKNPRKTLKFLQNNRFQWIAYHTETMRFSGTGGGSFSSKDGVYVEMIDFFSKDDSRVGARLDFNYELKDNDWHHTGKNSKGEPMYEIWGRRE